MPRLTRGVCRTIQAAVILAAIGGPALAAPSDQVVQCTAPCQAADGTTQPTGTFLNRIYADPATFNPGPGLTLIPDTGQAIYVPPSVPGG